MADSTQREVVVTGLGATTPLGGDVAQHLGGRPRRAGPASAPSTEDWVELDLPVTFAAQLAVDPRRTSSPGSRPAGSTGPGRSR